MIALKVLDGRVRSHAIVPRFRLEEGLVDIQAASREASTWLERGAALVNAGNLTGGLSAMGNADTLIRLADHTAHDLAGFIQNCPEGLAGPDGHAS